MVDLKLIISIIGTVITIGLVTPLVSPLWKQLVFIFFALYTLPFLNFRKEFRGMVYDTASWMINFKPVFMREIKTLFSNAELSDDEIIIANKYRIYLLLYSILLLLLTL